MVGCIKQILHNEIPSSLLNVEVTSMKNFSLKYFSLKYFS